MISARSLLIVILLSVAVSGGASEYDPDIPTPESVLGYSLGSWVTDYARMESFFSTLAEASPRVLFDGYGTDYEKRTLRYAVVSTPENLERLDAIREATARLADPRGLDSASISKLIDDTPLVIWLNYSTDGNETAGLESAIMMAYHLAAATDEATKRLLTEAVVVITPIMNPSSHERWAGWSNSFAALGGNSDPRAMEHHPPWGVSTNNNHYLVDLNRESIWATQRESAALRDLYYEWHPVIFVDHHGEYDNFAGPGYEEPLNPLFTQGQRRWLSELGQAIGRRFGERGWSYSPWETGTFYPGFWESIGLLNGAVGFTYETTGGGRKGLQYRRDDGSLITLRTAAQQHYEASLTVIETAVERRRELLEDFADFFRTALALERSAPEKIFILDPAHDAGRAETLLGILMANRIEVYRTTTTVEGREVSDYLGNRWEVRSFPAGVYVIPVAQPQARLLVTLMRKDLQLPEVTREAAEIFRRNREIAGFYNANIGKTRYLFYDVTAWSMPLTFGVDAYWASRPLEGDFERVTSLDAPGNPPEPARPANYGYLFRDVGNSTMALLADMLEEGIVVNVAYSAFRIGGIDYPRGSLLVRVNRNPTLDLPSVLSEIGGRHGFAPVPVDSPHSEAGPSLGSDRFVFVRAPRVAVLAGDPVSTRSFGDLWFILEQFYSVSFSAIYKEQLDAETLDEYDVLVLPHGWYGQDTFPADWLEDLQAWISRGGTLICLKGAARWAADPELGLASARLRPARWPLEGGEGRMPRNTMEIPGAILRTNADEHHFLTIGYDKETPVLVDSNLAFALDPDLSTPLRFAQREQLHLAGFAYEDSLERLSGTPYLISEQHGSGRIILFLDDPGFRVYWLGLHRLILNGLLLSPSF